MVEHLVDDAIAEGWKYTAWWLAMLSDWLWDTMVLADDWRFMVE